MRQAGEPITVATGNVFEQTKDYTTAGQNPLSFTRYYNSLGSTIYSGTSAHTLGVNWRGTYDSFLHISPATGQATSVVAERADGQVISFTFNGSTWTTDTDVDATLAQSGSTWTLKDHNDTVFIYAANSSGVGLLNSITARNGYTQTLSYNGSNQLTSVTDSYGRTLTLTYNASGLLNTVSTLGSLVLTYGYSSSGTNGTTLDRLASVSYNTSPVTSQTYVYGNSSFPFALTSRIDENGNTANAWTYDTVGRGISSERFSAVNTPVEQTTFAYNADGTVTVTNPLGEQDTYTFTTLQKLPKVTGISRAAIGIVAAASETMTYDASGYQASATDWNGNKTTYVNNSRGEPTTIVEAAGASVARTTKITYSATFREPTLIVRPLNTEAFDLDAKGNILTDTTTDPATGKEREWTYTYNGTGEVLTAKGPRTDVNQTTTMTYDTHGDLSTVSNALGQETQLTSYSADGRLESMTDPNGLVTNMDYDLRGQVISRAVGSGSSFETTRWTRDKAENVTKATFSDASALTYTLDAANRVVGVTNSLDQKIVYTLNVLGNRKAVQVYDVASTLNRTHTYTYDALGRMKTSVGALDQTTTYDYDSNGNLVSVTDPLTEITVFGYDALNRRDTVTDPLHNTVTTTYDALDLPIKVVTQRGVTTSYLRDGFGDITETKSPDTGPTTRTFDSAGNPATSLDALGQLTTFSYDALNRETKAAYTGGSSATFVYDTGSYGIGHLSSATGRQEDVTHYGYDQHGRVILEQQVLAARTFNTGDSFDSFGRPASMTYPSGLALTYGYDVAGQVDQLKVNGSAFLSGITHEPFGPVKGWTWGAGTNTTYSRGFDMDGRLSSYPLVTGTRTVTYDMASRVSTVADSTGTQTIGYDADSRVHSYLAPGSINKSYTYDDDGNRLTSVVAGTGTTIYSIDPGSNVLASRTPPASAAVTYTTDADGSVAAEGTYSFTYDVRDRMVAMSVPSLKDSTSYTVDAFGRRSIRSGAGGSWFNSFDPDGDNIGDYSTTSTGAKAVPLDETIRLEGLPVGVALKGSSDTPSSLLRVYAGHLNEPRAVTNDSAQERWTWPMTDPFGNTAANQNPAGLGTFQYNLRFPGQAYDPESGNFYNMNRDYEPASGRYIQSDPIGLAGGINTYAYAGGNPIQSIDPLGMQESVPYFQKFLFTYAYTESAVSLANTSNSQQDCAAFQQLEKAVKQAESTQKAVAAAEAVLPLINGAEELIVLPEKELIQWLQSDQTLWPWTPGFYE
jgi:RHS repeat-associated protein